MKHRFPPIELLEGNHQFPGPYIFKIIGVNENGFASRVLDAAKSVLEPHQHPHVSSRDTEGGKHQAITLEIIVLSAPQVIQVYEKLVEVEGVIVLF